MAQVDLLIFPQHGYQITGVQGIPVAPQISIIPLQNHGFLQPIALQVIDHISVGIHIRIGKAGIQLVQNGFRVFCCSAGSRQVNLLNLCDTILRIANCQSISGSANLTNRSDYQIAGRTQLACHTKLYSVAILGNAYHVVAGQGSWEAHIPGTGCILIHSLTTGNGSYQGVVNIFPLAIVLIVNSRRIHGCQTKAVVHDIFFVGFTASAFILRDNSHCAQHGIRSRIGLQNCCICCFQQICQCLAGHSIDLIRNAGNQQRQGQDHG